MKILICDDDLTELTKSTLILNKLGYKTISINKANEALNLLTSPNAPKMAILDWMMPGYSGLDICKKVRLNSTLISSYIIILTAKHQPSDLAEAFDAGANDYIKKPFDPIELNVRVRLGVQILSLETHIKTLTGLLSICSWCKKILIDEGKCWIQIEDYIKDHSYAEFTHGICPTCVGKFKSDNSSK